MAPLSMQNNLIDMMNTLYFKWRENGRSTTGRNTPGVIMSVCILRVYDMAKKHT